MKSTISFHQPTLKAQIASSVSNWLASDNRVYSRIMEEKVSNRSALLITHAMLSLSCLLTFAVLHWAAAVVLFCWFGWAVRICWKGGLK